MEKQQAPYHLCYITAIADTQYKFLEGQNQYLAERGFRFSSICTSGEKVAMLRQRDGVEVYPLAISRRITPWRDLISIVQMTRVLRKIQPDLLHVSTPKAAILGAIAGRLSGCRTIVYLVRGSATESETGLRRWCYRWGEWLTDKLAHVTLCISRSSLAFMETEGILRAGKGRMVGAGMSNGIDVQRFDPARQFDHCLLPKKIQNWLAEKCTVLGFVGRLAGDKGIGDLEQAWRVIRERRPETRLLLVGSWSETAPVDAAARNRLEQDERVMVTGFTDQVDHYLQVMNLFVFPSHGTEGFPNAVAEASAMGLPVIGTRIVGVVDAIAEGQTGQLVAPRHVAELTAAIEGYLSQPELMMLHGANGRKRVCEWFAREKVWQAFHQTYLQILQERGEKRTRNVQPACEMRVEEKRRVA